MCTSAGDQGTCLCEGRPSTRTKFCSKINYLLERPMVPLAGIEPATSGSTIRRSNHLSYNGTFAEPDQGGKFTLRDPLCRSAMRPYGLMDLNSRLLLGKGRFPTKASTFRRTKKKAGGRRCRPFPVTSQREEVLAGHPGEQREEVPLAGYSSMATIIRLIVFKKMRPFVASSDHA